MSGLIDEKQKALDELETLRVLSLKFGFALVSWGTYEVMQRDYIEKYGKDGHVKSSRQD